MGAKSMTVPPPPLPDVRCRRCATMLRGGRTICPSCGLDREALQNPRPEAPTQAQAQPQPQPAAIQPARQVAEAKAAPRPTNKLCQVCFASLPEADLKVVDGKAVCPQCVGMMNKTAQANEPQTASPQAAAPRTASRQTASVAKRPTPLPTQPAVQAPGKSPSDEIKFNRYQEEQLKKKLTWVKVVLVIAALCLLFTGGVTFFVGDLGETVANSNSLEDQALAMMEEAGSTPEEIERSRKEEAAARLALRKAASAAKTIAMVQIAIAAVFIVMFFLTNSYPFEISLAALVLYVLLEIWSISSEGMPGLIGCLIIFAIVANLGMGVQAGWQIKKLRAEAA